MAEGKKIKYRATYRDPKQNPFAPRLRFYSKTADVDASVPIEQVKEWAREASEGYELVDVVVVD